MTGVVMIWRYFSAMSRIRASFKSDVHGRLAFRAQNPPARVSTRNLSAYYPIHTVDFFSLTAQRLQTLGRNVGKPPKCAA